MHNGVYKTLEEVIKFYKLGGGNGIGMNLEYQTLPFDNLNLTDEEMQDILNFLKTLSDEEK
jgi:cytochrome c peroxidase